MVLARQPIEATDLEAEQLPIDAVNSDNIAAAGDLARHLVAEGHAPSGVRRYAVHVSLTSHERWSCLQVRLRRGRHLELAEALPADLSEDEGRRIADELIDGRHLGSVGRLAPRPT